MTNKNSNLNTHYLYFRAPSSIFGIVDVRFVRDYLDYLTIILEDHTRHRIQNKLEKIVDVWKSWKFGSILGKDSPLKIRRLVASPCLSN